MAAARRTAPREAVPARRKTAAPTHAPAEPPTPPQSPQPLPDFIQPMLAKSSGPFDDDRFLFEVKWDGTRALTFIDGPASPLRMMNRRKRDIAWRYPELRFLTGLPPGTVLDGEVVCLDAEGRPDFQRLQSREQVHTQRRADHSSRVCPATYVVFDQLYEDGRPIMDLPCTERRGRLRGLVTRVNSPRLVMSEGVEAAGVEYFNRAVGRGLEGVVAKRLDSAYLPGQRSPAWTKVKATKRDEFVVGGWLPGEGNREGRIGALLVGLPDGEGGLVYSGGVGTGFTDKELRRLKERLDPLRTTTSPFTTPLPRRDAVFVRPEVVADIEYRERTTGGILRQPSYKGERMDKGPADVETGGSGGARRRG